MKWLKRYYKNLKIELNKRFSIYWDQSTTHDMTTLFVISIIMQLASAAITSAMKPKMPQAPEREGIKMNTKTTDAPLKLVYGTHRVGGNDVYGSTLGSKNKWLYLIQTLSEGECDSIESIGGTPQIFIDDKIYTDFGSLVNYSFHNGSSTQSVDSVLNSADAQWTDSLENTSYIRWRFKWDEDKFCGVPKRQLNLKGIKVHDFRSPSDPDTWSDNAALCLYDYFTNSRYGLSIPSSKIDVSSWTVAANYIDSKGWGCNLVIALNDRNAWSPVEDTLALFRGTISWFDGKYYLYLADLNEESSQMTIEDKNIAQDESGKAMIQLIQPSRFGKPDGLRVTFVDKEKEYTSDDIVIGESSGLVEQMDLAGCTDREMASNLGTSQLERLKLDRTISGTFSDDSILLGPHDIVTFNSDALAISDQTMRVLSTNVTESGLINMTLGYESYDLYDDDYDFTVEGVYTVDLPDPSEISLIENPTIEEETYYYRLRTFSRLNIDFVVPETEPWFKHCEVWMSTTGDTPSAYMHQFNTTSNFSIDPVEEGKTYHIKLRPVNIWGARQTLDDSYKMGSLILGKTDAPESLTSLVAIPGDGSIRLQADKLSDPDIESYQFRMYQWTGGSFLSEKRAPTEVLHGTKPGEHTFTANTKSTAGIYGESAQSATVTLPKPKGWSDYTTFTDDYSSASPSGTYVNTEHHQIGADDYIKCSHNGGVLTGTYETKTFDTSASDTYFSYVDSDISITGLGSTWNDIIPSTSPSATAWEDINISSKSWIQLFDMGDDFTDVDIDIHHKQELTDDWSIVKKCEISACTVLARYFKVKIAITDPGPTANAMVSTLQLKLLN